MKKSFTLFVAAALGAAAANAQVFQNVLGNSNVSESVQSVTQSADSTYLLTGSFYQFNATKAQEFVTHLKKNGSFDWSKRITIPGLSNASYLISSQAEAVKKSNGKPDGYIMLIDETESLSQDADCYLVRLTNNGSVSWARHITFVSGKKVRPSYDANGTLTGFIILGDALSGNAILKTDVSGNQGWQKRITTNLANALYRFQDLQATADGGCVVAGNLYVNSELSKAALFKMDNAGNITWGHEYILNADSEGPPNIRGVAITPTGYAITGYNTDVTVGRNITFTTNNTGVISWAFKYLNTGSGLIGLPGFSIASDASGKLVIATLQLDNSTESDAAVIKLNAAGTLVFAKSFDGSNGLRDIKVTNTNTYCATGRAQPGPNQNIFVTNISSAGNNQAGCQPATLTMTTIATFAKTTQTPSYNATIIASANTAVTATAIAVQTPQSLCGTLMAEQEPPANTDKLTVANDMAAQRVLLKWETTRAENTTYQAVLCSPTGMVLGTTTINNNQPAYMPMQNIQPGIYSILLKQNSSIVAKEKVVWVK